MKTKGKRVRVKTVPQYDCPECGRIPASKLQRDLTHTPDLGERLDPGSTVPVGECECGALYYLIPNRDKTDTVALLDACEKLVSTIDNTGGLVPAEDSPLGMKAPSVAPDWIDLGEAYLAAKKALKSTRDTSNLLALLREVAGEFGPQIDADEDIQGTEAVDALVAIVRATRKALK